jgi:pimeloyl-ACP methyl ester carboxylesterase
LGHPEDCRGLAELMRELGYKSYGTQGGDAGSVISLEVARAVPSHVIGTHVNMLMTFPSGDPAELADLNETDQARLGKLPLTTPVGVAVFPRDIFVPIRRLADCDIPTLSHWTEFSDGGHFAAMEQPKLLTDDIRSFFRLLT